MKNERVYLNTYQTMTKPTISASKTEELYRNYFLHVFDIQNPLFKAKMKSIGKVIDEETYIVDCKLIRYQRKKANLMVFLSNGETIGVSIKKSISRAVHNWLSVDWLDNVPVYNISKLMQYISESYKRRNTPLYGMAMEVINRKTNRCIPIKDILESKYIEFQNKCYFGKNDADILIQCDYDVFFIQLLTQGLNSILTDPSFPVYFRGDKTKQLPELYLNLRYVNGLTKNMNAYQKLWFYNKNKIRNIPFAQFDHYFTPEFDPMTTANNIFNKKYI